MQEFTSASGAKVIINLAPFDDAMELKSAVLRQISAADIKIDPNKIKLADDIDIEGVIKAVIAVDCSPEVNAAVMRCLLKCTYDGHKITKATFEDGRAREDYYEIMIACLKVNLIPFFRKVFSLLSTLLSGLGVDTQKLKSQMKPDSLPSN